MKTENAVIDTRSVIYILIAGLLIMFTYDSVAGSAYKALQKNSSWAGLTTDSNDEDIKTILKVEESGGNYNYTLIYKTPRNCRLKAEELMADDNTLKLKFFEANGGFCDKLYKGKITITVKDRKTAKAKVEQKSKNISEIVTLKLQ